MQEREPKWRGRTLAMEFWLGTVLVGGHSAANGMAPRRAAGYRGAPSGIDQGVSGDLIFTIRHFLPPFQPRLACARPMRQRQLPPSSPPSTSLPPRALKGTPTAQ